MEDYKIFQMYYLANHDSPYPFISKALLIVNINTHDTYLIKRADIPESLIEINILPGDVVSVRINEYRGGIHLVFGRKISSVLVQQMLQETLDFLENYEPMKDGDCDIYTIGTTSCVGIHIISENSTFLVTNMYPSKTVWLNFYKGDYTIDLENRKLVPKYGMGDLSIAKCLCDIRKNIEDWKSAIGTALSYFDDINVVLS